MMERTTRQREQQRRIYHLTLLRRSFRRRATERTTVSPTRPMTLPHVLGSPKPRKEEFTVAMSRGHTSTWTKRTRDEGSSPAATRHSLKPGTAEIRLMSGKKNVPSVLRGFRGT